MAHFLGSFHVSSPVAPDGLTLTATERCLIRARNVGQAKALLKKRSGEILAQCLDVTPTWDGDCWCANDGEIRATPSFIEPVSALVFDELRTLLDVVSAEGETLPESVLEQGLPEAAKTLARRVGEQLRKAGGDVAHGRLLKAIAAALGKTDWQVLKAQAGADSARVTANDVGIEVKITPRGTGRMQYDAFVDGTRVLSVTYEKGLARVGSSTSLPLGGVDLGRRYVVALAKLFDALPQDTIAPAAPVPPAGRSVRVRVALDCDGVDREFEFDAAPGLQAWPWESLEDLLEGRYDEYTHSAEEMNDLVETCCPEAADYRRGVRDSRGGCAEVPMWVFKQVDEEALRKYVAEEFPDEPPVGAAGVVSGLRWKRKILARFVPQAVQGDYYIDIDGAQDFDVTQKIFDMPVEDIQELQDNRDRSDMLCDPRQDFGHYGPFYVQVESALMEFFDVCDLGEITQELKNEAFQKARE